MKLKNQTQVSVARKPFTAISIKRFEQNTATGLSNIRTLYTIIYIFYNMHVTTHTEIHRYMYIFV